MGGPHTQCGAAALRWGHFACCRRHRIVDQCYALERVFQKDYVAQFANSHIGNTAQVPFGGRAGRRAGRRMNQKANISTSFLIPKQCGCMGLSMLQFIMLAALVFVSPHVQHVRPVGAWIVLLPPSFDQLERQGCQVAVALLRSIEHAVQPWLVEIVALQRWAAMTRWMLCCCACSQTRAPTLWIIFLLMDLRRPAHSCTVLATVVRSQSVGRAMPTNNSNT